VRELIPELARDSPIPRSNSQAEKLTARRSLSTTTRSRKAPDTSRRVSSWSSARARPVSPRRNDPLHATRPFMCRRWRFRPQRRTPCCLNGRSGKRLPPSMSIVRRVATWRTENLRTIRANDPRENRDASSPENATAKILQTVPRICRVIRAEIYY
jgi:hypothetical protein